MVHFKAWDLEESGSYPYKISVAFKEISSARFSLHQLIISRQNACTVGHSYRRWIKVSLGELRRSQRDDVFIPILKRLLFVGRMLWIIWIGNILVYFLLWLWKAFHSLPSEVSFLQLNLVLFWVVKVFLKPDVHVRFWLWLVVIEGQNYPKKCGGF